MNLFINNVSWSSILGKKITIPKIQNDDLYFLSAS